MAPPKLRCRDRATASPAAAFSRTFGVYASPTLLATRSWPPATPSISPHGDALAHADCRGLHPPRPADDLLLVADIAWVQARFEPSHGRVSEARVRLAASGVG
ncbi:MAG: hypothetical protein IPK39_11780 [Sulfuritalea sp.]|nr:hypothetical protein [Sulfuritalea sp.]